MFHILLVVVLAVFEPPPRSIRGSRSLRGLAYAVHNDVWWHSASISYLVATALLPWFRCNTRFASSSSSDRGALPSPSKSFQRLASPKYSCSLSDRRTTYTSTIRQLLVLYIGEGLHILNVSNDHHK
ncbi:hypothetical protein PF008_g7436 [Phytophthora fragariae]|uniref:Uncharacterized protein n=1 Tax=Phytophthora fragariae TaxID=53985 RepID=A0A6G0S323_9STRA|nr:hypothetical protein PF008_g7436 [Phytophthora fragariae]